MRTPLRRVRVITQEYVPPVPGTPAHYKPMPSRCAVFHCWGVSFDEFESGPGNYSTAIVEFPDGSIEAIYPHQIKFEVEQ
jgi:hypothetical protein